MTLLLFGVTFFKESEMTNTFILFLSTYIKFFFLLTPFFIVSIFLALTADVNPVVKKLLAIKVTFGVEVISLILLFFGDKIFSLLGISIAAFKIGAGVLLFLSVISLVQGKPTIPDVKTSVMDLAIVPMAIPITLGPGSVGALVVISNTLNGMMDIFVTAIAITLAVFSVGVMLYAATYIESIIGEKGIQMLSKITGLILASLSAQMIFEGAATFL